MNKKFSTLMTAALLMAGALFSNVQAQIKEGNPTELANNAVITNGAKYYLGDVSGKYVQATLKTVSGDATKKVLTPAEATTADAATLFEAVVTNAGGTKLIQFKATVGDFTGFLSVDATGAVFGDTPTAAAINTAKSGFDYVEKYVNGTGIALALHGFNNKFLKGDGAIESTTQNVLFYQPASITVDAEELYKQNANRNTLSFGVKDIKSSLFGKSFKAFEVSGSTVDADGNRTYVPAGTYFATSYPEELAASTVQTIDNIADFQKCTFIAVDPVTSLGDKDDLKAGKYLSFKEVAGKNLRFATTTGSEVSVNNAAFTVTTTMAQKDADGNHSFSIAATFNYRPEADKKAHASAGGVITVDKIGGVKVLSISKGAEASYIFSLSAGPVAKPIDLLSKTGASVYNVKFLSGKAEEELGKYLGVGITSGASNFEFLAQGTAVANLSTPQYQFVISEVDTETNKITFTNRETKEGFVCLLDTTTTAGVYTVVSITKTGSADPEGVKVANLGTNGKYDFTKTIDMTGKTIQLIPATVDMFAGFSVRGTELDQTFITFAKDENDADRFYVKAEYTLGGSASVTQEAATDDEIEASLFELVRSEKPVYVRSDYAYDNDGEVGYVSNGDTVAYYTYYIKYVNPVISGDNQFYMKKANLDLEQKTPAQLDAAHEFILKENNDGSVSIIAAPASGFATYNMKAVKLDATSSKADILTGVDAYLNANATDLKLFLVKEGLGATLDAVPAHVALHATTGGYVSLSEKNEGIVAIETAVSEDLTFWLDTADSKATLPAFYISKGMNKGTKAADTDRLFMYFAQDSANYFVEKEGVKNPYEWSNGKAKIIFKAATLANADTLVTTANGKTINVAIAADVNGTQGGLNNFRFQIFKADDAEDAYVVRNAGGQYLVSIANQLQLGDKKDALKLYAEEGMSPVANDAINVSSISVISGNGAIIVKGAQGKKVVVSNVLGQTIANTVLSSDNATISAPAGIVVVAVEGEAAVKAIVK